MRLTAERQNCRSCNAIHGLIHSRNVARMIALRAHNTAANRTRQIKNAPASQAHTTPHSTTALTGGHRTGPRPARVPRAGICHGCHRHRIVPDQQVIPHPVHASYASPAPCHRPVFRAHREPRPRWAVDLTVAASAVPAMSSTVFPAAAAAESPNRTRVGGPRTPPRIGPPTPRRPAARRASPFRHSGSRGGKHRAAQRP
jgi:hypothetical protein